MATCRIYLLTYRRPKLLPRALTSLLNQTLQDWICELHNDDPTDLAPSKLVEEIGDPRISVMNHAQNLGPTPTFNLVFQKVNEPFVSLLEDDNWWEPTFLEKMLEAMQQHPQVEMAWSNMRMWQEQDDEHWIELEKTTFPFSINEPYKLFDWGHTQQVLGTLHSNGAMLIRSNQIEKSQIPASTPFAMIEHVRERTFRHPILFVNQTLANFAVTRSTSRSNNASEWGAGQLLLATTFLKHMPKSEDRLIALWQQFRNQKPAPTSALLWSGLLNSQCRYLLAQATARDWLMFFLSVLKRPMRTYQMFQIVNQLAEVQQFLDCNTQQRFQTHLSIKDS